MTTNNVTIDVSGLTITADELKEYYLLWVREYLKDSSEEITKEVEEVVEKFPVVNDFSGYDPSGYTGASWRLDVPEDVLELEETEFETINGCEYSIFEDDEVEDTYHLEIDPDWTWSKDDVWDLIDKLLYTIGEIDENGELIGKGPEKQLFIISTPGPVSKEVGDQIGLHAKEALDKANIDAVPLILSDGLKVWFEKPRA